VVRLANWVVQLANKTVQEIGQERIHILCYKTVGSHSKQLFNRSRAVYTRESSSEWP
jgi:hypothetical protein